jgi:exodeoxyribonuclease V alpha subunit
MVHEYIRDSRSDRLEEENAGKHFSAVKGYEPPCSSEISLLSLTPSSIVHTDPLDWRRLQDMEEDLEAYSFCARPYGRMFSKEKGVTWESDPEKQLDRLNEYFGAIEEGHSLVFFYTNYGNPLVDESGDRLLIGVARIKKKGQQLYFPKTPKYSDDYPIWSRSITIDYPAQSAIIPYQDYLKQGYNPSNIICRVPGSLREQFSYVSEHLTDDEAVVALEAIIQTARIVQRERKVSEDWGLKIKWLNMVLSEIWTNRGAYPGTGSVLEYLGMTKGTIYQFEILQEISKKGKDALEHLSAILNGKRRPEKKFKDDLNVASKEWRECPESRRRLLRILCLFGLTKEQVERVSNPTLRQKAGIFAESKCIIDNPYFLCEQDSGGKDSSPIGFEQIDHGMIPLTEAAKGWENHVAISPSDKRRVRALLVDILKSAAQSGDTLLSLGEAISRAQKRLPDERKCNPDPELIVEQADFYREAIDFDPESKNPYLALPRLRQMETEISQQIDDLLKDDPRPPSGIDWQRKLQKELGVVGLTHLDAEVEARAQKEKAEALEKMFRFRLSLLTGRAGTGKTTVVKILLQGIAEKEGRTDILLLAPTGKARVRLQKLAEREAMTIHQFLNSQEWLDRDTFTFKDSGGKQSGASTIIIDEASMIPLDLLGTLFRAIRFNDVKRLILIGDSNQLPPIGPGRTFVDIISWLDETDERRKHLAYLRERARQRKESQASEALRLSDGYIADFPTPNDDEMLSEVSHGYNKGDLEVHFWNNIDELYNILNKRMLELLSLDETDTAYISFNKSLGIGEDTDKDPENWQILSPVRMQRFGTREINRLIQRKYRKGLMERCKWNRATARPFGDEDIVYTDKVIQIVNSPRKAWIGSSIDGYVANGEVGYIANTSKGEKRYKDSLDVRFSTQPDMTYRYYRPEVDENLELAYAITVHKAQGSEFEIVFLILPQKARTFSRELLYTGLTRSRKKLVLLIEKDITPLKVFRKMQESETFLRNTNLFTPIVRPEGVTLPYPEKLIHRTLTGELVRSKSEVVVANVLTKLGIDYKYEEPLEVSPHDFRLPDFTISFKGKTWYWEHLGMLNLEFYKKEWEQKKAWYEKHKLIDRVITSQDGPDGSIDSQEIEKTAKEKILRQQY